MTLKLAAALAALSMALAPAAFADEDSGFYAGGGIGIFNAGIDDLNAINPAADSWEEDDTAYKVFAGYRVNKVIGFEIDYINLGEPSGAVGGLDVESSIEGFAPYVIATVPLGIFEFYGRLGYFFYDAEVGVQDVLGGNVQIDESAEDFVYGLGFGLDLLDHINIRFEYERFEVTGLDDTDAVWLTGAWRF